MTERHGSQSFRSRTWMCDLKFAPPVLVFPYLNLIFEPTSGTTTRRGCTSLVLMHKALQQCSALESSITSLLLRQYRPRAGTRCDAIYESSLSSWRETGPLRGDLPTDWQFVLRGIGGTLLVPHGTIPLLYASPGRYDPPC